MNGELREETNSFAKMRFAVADVRAKGEVNRRHIGLLLYADATAEETEHGVGFGEFQGEGDGEENDAVEAEDENGEKDMPAMPERNEKASRSSGSEKRSDPDLHKK